MKSLIFAAILSLFFVGTANGDEPSSRNPFGSGVGKQQWQKPKPQPAQKTVLGLQSYRQNRPMQSNYNNQGTVIYQYNYRPNFYQYNYYNSYYYRSRVNFYYQQRMRGHGFAGFLFN